MGWYTRLMMRFWYILILAFSSTAFCDADGDSVYKVNLWTDSAIVLTGGLIAVAANTWQYSIINQSCPCDPNGINFIDKSEAANTNHSADIFANYTVTAAMVAPVVIDYLDVGMTKSFAEDMFVYSEVLSVNFGLVTLAKFSFQRPYPYMYQRVTTGSGFQSEPTDYLSFYSGHTTTTISALAAASATLNLRHGKTIWPWIVTGVLGTSVAVELIISGEHFISDVVVGAMMGLAIGTIIPAMHARGHDPMKHIFFTAGNGGPEVIWTYDF